ncbi:MAG TPA: D-glycerate dehydrogenase [Acidimicrobiia bacterium]|nr:D-glycerate dehydrogenase [Acidimicrobiia bacterium]
MKNRPNVLVTRRPPGRAIGMLEQRFRVDLWDENRAMPRDRLLDRIRKVDGLYSMLTDLIDTELFEAGSSLRAVSQMAVGVDNVDLAAATRLGIPVGHTPEVLNETTADTVFGLLLASVRRIGEGAAYVRAGRWGPWQPDLLLGGDLYQTTLGIIGMGRIGSAIARRARGFDVRILYSNRHPDPAAERELGAQHRTLEDLLRESDHVVVMAPLNSGTYHLIDEPALRLMKPTATLVNGSRGGLVDLEALERALREGWIARAALDVTEPEPIPPDHPLLGLDNCLIIPHLGSASVATRISMAELAAENLIAGLEGRPMTACANPEVHG